MMVTMQPPNPQGQSNLAPNEVSLAHRAPFTANGQEISESHFQQLALNPKQNVVIEACAGSGKTWLLVVRMLKLLLSGVAPKQILAITFTRKATQEMKQRLADMLDQLYQHAQDSDPALLHALGLSTVNASDVQAAILPAWRQCCQQGVWPSIVTFHEWFGELRQNAPLSMLANAGARLTEDELPYVDLAWQQFWRDIQRTPALRASMQSSVVHLGLHEFERVLNDMLARRGEWLVHIQALLGEPEGGRSQALAPVLAQQVWLNTVAPCTVAELWSDLLACKRTVLMIANLYRNSQSKTAAARASKLDNALSAIPSASTNATFKCISVWVNSLLKPLSMATGGVIQTTHFKDMLPALNAHFINDGALAFSALINDLYGQLSEILHRISVHHMVPLHLNMLECGHHLIQSYQAVKISQGVMDFGDLELDAYRMLALPTRVVDGTYPPLAHAHVVQHVLLDEFQDTNPVQWQVLQAFVLPLLQESKAGGQASSVFVVGDPKQSIYRFRRADPKLFTHAQQLLHGSFDAVLLKTQRTRRNAQSINAWVNHVFAPAQLTQQACDPFVAPNETLATPLFQTQYTHSDVVGRVGALPLIGATELFETAESALADTHSASQQSITRCDDEVNESQLIVRTLLSWKERHPHKHWGDAMVLARTRQALATLSHALQAHNIAHVRSETGGFFQLPEIEDCLTMLTALNNPADALSTLAALRSPIFDLNDHQLGALLSTCAAHSMQKQLWLGLAQLSEPWAKNTLAWLKHWQHLCSHLPIHDALDAMMHQGQWISRFEAAHPERAALIPKHLAQLLQLALSVDQGRYPSLPRFVYAVQLLRSSNQVSPSAQNAAQAVRLSTIHGAKGLEASCVVLMDLYSKPKPESTHQILLDWPAQQHAPSLFAIQLCSSQALQQIPAWAHCHANEQTARKTEQDTLLYVAMTRAVDELWISATPKRNPNSVYERLNTALQPVLNGSSALPWESKLGLTPPLASIDVAHQPNSENFATAKQQLLGLPALHQHPPLERAGFDRVGLLVNPSQELSKQQQGIVMHGILEHYLRHHHWPNAVQLSQWHTQDSQMQRMQTLSLLERCQGMVNTVQLPQLLKTPASAKKQMPLSELTWADKHSVYLAIEQAIVCEAVQLLRPDLVAYLHGQQCAWVIDYKLQFDPTDELANAYAEQLGTYKRAIQNDEFKNVTTYVLTLKGQCWCLDERQSWRQCQPPWLDLMHTIKVDLA